MNKVLSSYKPISVNDVSSLELLINEFNHFS